MTKTKNDEKKTAVCKTLYRKLKTEPHESNQKPYFISGASDGNHIQLHTKHQSCCGGKQNSVIKLT